MNKNAIIGLVVVVAAGVGAWIYYGQRSAPVPPAPSSESTPAAVGDEKAGLMQAGPLGDNVLGKPDAPVTIIEYASTTCPHCAHFHETVFPELKKRYIDTGQVRFIFREFPLNDPDFFAYMLTRCIGKDKFFDFLDVLFKQQKKWAVEQYQGPLTDIAKQAGFTDESIKACFQNKQVQEHIEGVSKQAVKFKVNSTPTFFINGQKYTGGPSLEEMEKIIAGHLKS